MTDLRTRLRAVPTLTGTPPAFDPARTPAAVAEQAGRLEAEPGLIAKNWTLYTLRADEVEFWQADPGRRHVRLRYRLDDPTLPWTKERLWP